MRILLRDLSAGQRYRIQVRSNDGESVSDWSQLFDFTTVVDNVAPNAPTSFAVVQQGTTSIATWVKPTTNADGSTLKDFDHYEVEAYSDGVTSIYQTGLERFEFSYEYNVTIFGQYKTNVGFRVRAVDQSGNASAWTTRTFGTDLPPSQPQAPILIKDTTDPSRTLLFVRHNLLRQDGLGRLETDVNRIKIYSTNSASSTPSVSGATLIGTMMVDGSSVFAISGTMDITPWTTKHFFVVAQDIGGNLSATSPTAPVSGATTGLFADVAVINVAYIDHLEANRIIAGTGFIDNITVKSSLIMGAARDGAAPSDTDGNGVPITQTVMRSADYKYGEAGWIIRGDGYAEFRNLAVNSLNIGKFDNVTQSMMSTKFADFMEDPDLWGRHTTSGTEEQDGGIPYDVGTFTGDTNANGAYSARALLTMQGKTSVRRKSSGLNRGISYEPGQIYKVWARIRQLTGPQANAINNPTFRGDVTNANTGDTASDGVANFWREYASITATKSLQSGITGPVTEITTAQRASGTIPAGGYVGFRANTPLLNSGVPNQNAIPVTPTLYYSCSAYFRGVAIPGIGSAYVAIEWYDAAGSLISTSIEGNQSVGGTGTWVRVSVSAIAPAGAAIASPRLRFSGSSAGTLTADFTGVMFTQSITTQPYFDGRSTYHAWSGDADASPSYETHTTKFRVGVLGFDDAGNLCAADGSTSSDPAMHYMVAADGTSELPTFDGLNSQSAGWIEVSGYLKDRTNGTTPPGLHDDSYDPAGVHQNVRFIVPFVQMNINDNGVNTSYYAQLDMFSIESSNTLAPGVVKTGITKGVTIENIEGDDWAHAIRFYSGNDDELYPALMTEIQDQDFNSTHTLVISPTQTLPGERTSLNDGMRLRGRNANLLSNASFENPFTIGASYAAMEGNRFTLGGVNVTAVQDTVNFHQGWGENSAKVTSVASGSAFIYHHLLATNFPELLGQTKLTLSAWVRSPATNPNGLQAGFTMSAYDDTGALLVASPALNTVSSTLSTPNDGNWYQITTTIDVSGTLPTGFPDNTVLWNIGFGFVATAGSQFFNIDDVQLELGDTVTTFKPQAPNSYYMPGAGMILGNTLVISDRIKSFDEMTNGRWTPSLDYDALNPSVQLENDGMTAVMEKVSITNSGGTTSSYLGFRVLDNQGVGQSPLMYIIDSNDQVIPNTIQFYNTNQQQTVRIGSLEDPTNPEANAAGKDLIVQGGFRASGTPNWTSATSLGTGFANTVGTYTLSTFSSNGTVYMRGSIFASSATANNGTIAVLASGHRPQVATLIAVPSAVGGASNTPPTMYVLQISTSGAITVRNGQGGLTGSAIPTNTIFFFDGISFSSAPNSPVVGSGGENPATIGAATHPSSFTITPYASSLTTGTYRLGWTNANDSDNAKLRIVWRVDRAPSSSTDGNIVTVTTVNNASQSYLLSGLPVGRRIYIKLYAINKAGVVGTGTPPSNSRFLLASPTVIYANSSASYRDGYGGMWRNDGDQLYQGEWTGNDNHRGLFFYGTQITDRLNTGGSARTPTKMTIYMQRTGSGGIYGSVPIDLYPHIYATKPAGAPGIVTGQTAGGNIVALKTNQGATITIPASWYPVYTSGTYKGFAIYNTGTDYAVLYGRSTNSAHGKLTIYHKG